MILLWLIKINNPIFLICRVFSLSFIRRKKKHDRVCYVYHIFIARRKLKKFFGIVFSRFQFAFFCKIKALMHGHTSRVTFRNDFKSARIAMKPPRPNTKGFQYYMYYMSLKSFKKLKNLKRKAMSGVVQANKQSSSNFISQGPKELLWRFDWLEICKQMCKELALSRYKGVFCRTKLFHSSFWMNTIVVTNKCIFN